MRQLQKQKIGRDVRAAAKGPLIEGIVQLDSRGRRKWSPMSDEEIVEYARKFMEEKGISGRTELSMVDRGLHNVLKRRGLLDEVGFEDKRKDWKVMSDEEIVRYAREFMREERIRRKGELYEVDPGLYYVLKKRRLLDEVGFEDKYRDWKEVSDGGLVEYARKFMEEKGISGRKELKRIDSGLYEILRTRKLLDAIEFEERQRDWSSMSDEEIVRYAKEFVEEKGISRRKELEKADGGLYDVLRRRRLLDQAFSSIDQSRRKEAILQVVEAMEEFAC
ncbi:hypothetical protein KKB44_06250 [Candidatus Micrarchaeota archaeon]|nr:hypothetical protein [Candidatus Micrarchaeota archaeon]